MKRVEKDQLCLKNLEAFDSLKKFFLFLEIVLHVFSIQLYFWLKTFRSFTCTK